MDKLRYQSGLANEFVTEALAGALPIGQNSPQKAPYGLYTEQLSGTAFTAPRASNRRSWLYRIQPAAAQGLFRHLRAAAPSWEGHRIPPDRLRWNPPPIPRQPTDFLDGLIGMGGNGGPAAQS